MPNIRKTPFRFSLSPLERKKFAALHHHRAAPVAALTFLLVLTILIPGNSQLHQLGTPLIENFEKSDYHGGTQNWAITQSESGIIFLGNNKGLLEYDREKWKLYTLPNSTVTLSLAFGEDDKLYAGGQNELGFFAPDAKGVLKFHSMTGSIPEAYRNFEDVWNIFVTPEGVFFCTQKVVFRWHDDQMDVITPPERFDNFFYFQGRLLLRDIRMGLVEWKASGLIPIPGGAVFTGSNAVRSLLILNESAGLLCTFSNGFFILDERGVVPYASPADELLKNTNIYQAIRLKSGNFALGTTTNGVFILDASTRPIKHLTTRDGLQNNTILSLYEDLQQNLWLGLDNGIDLVLWDAPFSFIGSATGTDGTGYAAVVHNQRLYLGTNQGLFHSPWPPPASSTEPALFRAVPGTKGQVWSLNVLDGELLMGHHEGDFRITDGAIERISANNQGIWKFAELPGTPGYAIAGSYSGLLLYSKDENTGKWAFRKKLEGFEESARVLEVGAGGDIWVTHVYKGVFRIILDYSDHTIQQVHFYNSSNGLPNDLSINVAKIRGEILFTSPSGVYTFDPATGSFNAYRQLNDLLGASSNILRLLEDKNGNIWYAVENEFGLIRVREQGLSNQIKKIPLKHLSEKLVDRFEYVYAPNEKDVFIGVEKGFLHYRMASDSIFSKPFRVVLRNISLLPPKDSVLFGGQPFGTGGSLAIKAGKALKPRNNSLRFSFAAPFFETGTALEYRFQLDGFDEEWSAWNRQTEKEYTNLPYGEYTFRVQARNAYQQVSPVSSYVFRIRTPWYATSVFKVLLFLLALTGILLQRQFYARKARRETTALKAKQAQRLQAKEAEFLQEKARTEAEIMRLRNEKLKADVQHKTRELASSTMHLLQKGEILTKIQHDLEKIKKDLKPEHQKELHRLIRTIDGELRLDDDWEQFEVYFDQVHENFLKRLRENFPNLTPKDQKLCAYLRMNLTTKEIAPLLKISVRGVEISRYRLRKKMELDTETNLVDFIMKI